jgi:hypothetical protein
LEFRTPFSEHVAFTSVKKVDLSYADCYGSDRKTYLQDFDSVRGYFLTILVALYIRYRILNILKDNVVNGKLSVNDVVTELSRLCIITTGIRKVLSEITKKAGEIEEVIGIKLFPKILRS